MVFSGVAGSRPARKALLADGDGKRTIKGNRPAVPKPHQGLRDQGLRTGGLKTLRPQDNASISTSLKSPGTMTTGIGNEPTALAIRVMSGPGPSGPGLAASTRIAISTSLSITSRICSVGSP